MQGFFTGNLLQAGGQHLFQAGKTGEGVLLGGIGLSLDQGQHIVDELLSHTVPGLVDPRAGDLLLKVGHDIQGLQDGLAFIAAIECTGKPPSCQ